MKMLEIYMRETGEWHYRVILLECGHAPKGYTKPNYFEHWDREGALAECKRRMENRNSEFAHPYDLYPRGHLDWKHSELQKLPNNIDQKQMRVPILTPRSFTIHQFRQDRFDMFQASSIQLCYDNKKCNNLIASIILDLPIPPVVITWDFSTGKHKLLMGHETVYLLNRFLSGRHIVTIPAFNIHDCRPDDLPNIFWNRFEGSQFKFYEVDMNSNLNDWETIKYLF